MRRMSSILAAALFAGVAFAAADSNIVAETNQVINDAAAQLASTTAALDPKAATDALAGAVDPKAATEAVADAAEALPKADEALPTADISKATGGLVTTGPAPEGATVFVMPTFKLSEDATKPGCYTVGEATNQYALELCENTNALAKMADGGMTFGFVKGTLTNTGKEPMCNIAFTAAGDQALSAKLQSFALPEIQGAKMPTIDAPIKLMPGQAIEFGFKLPVDKATNEAPFIGLSNQLVPCAALEKTATDAAAATGKAAADAAAATTDAATDAAAAVTEATKPATEAVAGATPTLPKVEIDANGIAKAGSIIQDVPLITTAEAEAMAISPANTLSASLAGLVAVGAALVFQFAL